MTELMEKKYILVHAILASEGMTENTQKILVLSKMFLQREPR